MVQRKKVTNLMGFKVGRLTVVEYLGLGASRKHFWRCSCECGGQVDLATSKVKNGYTLSCGCLRREALNLNRCNPERHGLHKHKLYAVYYAMLSRCYNDKSQRWKYYGAKGVSVCDDWKSDVTKFVAWSLENGYKEGLSIDRVDSDGNYTPSNCEWVTVSENSRRMNVGRRSKVNDT